MCVTVWESRTVHIVEREFQEIQFKFSEKSESTIQWMTKVFQKICLKIKHAPSIGKTKEKQLPYDILLFSFRFGFFWIFYFAKTPPEWDEYNKKTGEPFSISIFSDFPTFFLGFSDFLFFLLSKLLTETNVTKNDQPNRARRSRVLNFLPFLGIFLHNFFHIYHVLTITNTQTKI